MLYDMFRFAVSNWNEKLSKWITKKQVLSEIEDWSKTDKCHSYTKITQNIWTVHKLSNNAKKQKKEKRE